MRSANLSRRRWSAVIATLVVIAACARAARLNVADGTGTQPTLPAPDRSLIPTVNVVEAVGWNADAAPAAASGLSVRAFARDLDHPRWLYVLPNGDVLVAETNAPRTEKAGVTGIKGWFFKRYKKKSGGGTPSADRITLLRDADGDGVAEVRQSFIAGIRSPFGMTLVGDTFYVAGSDTLHAFPYTPAALTITSKGRVVAPLPGGARNHHWTKSLIASPDGKKLYVGVGSNSNVADHGMAEEEGRAAIWEFDVATGASTIYATGLRNPVGMAWEPTTRALWVAVNERDELGSDLVPDYITQVTRDGFYGWPYSYFGQHVDTRAKPQRPDLVAKAIVPDYALGPHTASLGLAWSGNATLGPTMREGMFVGQHGSWNRKPRSGYKVIFVPFQGGKPVGQPIDVLAGFVTDDGDAYGRPVGVAVDSRGALLVADDVGNVIWRVTSTVVASSPRHSASPRN